MLYAEKGSLIFLNRKHRKGLYKFKSQLHKTCNSDKQQGFANETKLTILSELVSNALEKIQATKIVRFTSSGI